MQSELFKWWKKLGLAKKHLATIYYVAGDGDDANDGKHPLRAWQSIERLNKAKRQIKANDQILFKRGFSYLGRPFYLDQPNYQKRIGAYGSGRHPVFPEITKTKNEHL